LLEFAKSNSVVAVQRAFQQQFGCCGPPTSSTQRQCEHVTEAVSVFKGKVAQGGQALTKRPSRVRESFIWSPRKSVSRSK
jgi:hypothetical protein